ncbi:plasmid partition family protein [Borreliella carolinensis]
MSKINQKDIPIRILIKKNELYDFCNKDTKRVYFI